MGTNSCVAALAAGVVVGLAASANASVIRTWNLVVTGNLQNNSQDIEGSAFIGGNLTGGSPTVGLRLTPSGNFSTVTTLAVVGNTNVSNINLQAGDFRRAGSRSGNVNLNGLGSNEFVDPTLTAQLAPTSSELATTSNFLRNLVPNSTAQFPSGQPGPVRYNATPGGPDNLAVFSVSGANVFNNGLIQQIELNAGSSSSIVINVSGTNINFNNGNMVGSWTSAFARANVIWNFFEATTINLDRNFNGAILAPSAHLTNSTAIDGSVFVSSMTQNGEVHLPFYAGYIPAPSAMALLGLGTLVAARRKR